LAIYPSFQAEAEVQMKDKAPKKRNLRVLIILGTIGLTLGLLIYFEQIALIYGLTTMALIVLLLIVAFADLSKVGEEARLEAYGKTGREKENLRKNTLENIERRKAEERSPETVS
jgi:hypothetical protein